MACCFLPLSGYAEAGVVFCFLVVAVVVFALATIEGTSLDETGATI